MAKGLDIDVKDVNIEPKKVRFSLGGYSFKEWFKGNWNSIIETLKTGGTLFLGYILSIAFFKANPNLVPFVTAVLFLLGKWLVDMLHYFVIEKT
jgi:hypothetical protein